MKNLTLLLLALTLILPACKFFGGSKKELQTQVEQLQEQLKKDSLKNAAALDKIKQESASKLDSIQKCCGKSVGNYHVITGSFRNAGYAESFVKEMEKLGYKAQIVQAANGFNLVSAFAASNISEASSALNNMRTNVNPESWIYVAN